VHTDFDNCSCESNLNETKGTCAIEKGEKLGSLQILYLIMIALLKLKSADVQNGCAILLKGI
jgi:hypothetical protein